MISNNLQAKLHMILRFTVITFGLPPFCHVSTNKFNARSSIRWSGNINTRVGKELDSLTSTAGYTQLIDKSTHFFKGRSSCIDLSFCNKTDFISEYEIDQSIFQTYHHIIIFTKIDPKILPLPDYNREVWDYKKTNFSFQLEKCF